jgi:hypothetical protein
VGGKRFLWNLYNRRSRGLAVIDTTGNWAYTTDVIRQANGNAGNKVEYVCGLAEDAVTASVVANVSLQSNSVRAAKAIVGVDAITVGQGVAGKGFNAAAAQFNMTMVGQYVGVPGLGYHYLAWCEKGSDGTCTFLGNSAVGESSQSGLTAMTWG